MPAPYRAKVSRLEDAAGVLISSRSDPLETSSTSVAMRGASSSTIKSDLSLSARMRALSLDRLVTTRATAGFNRLPVLVGLAYFSCTRQCPDQEPRKRRDQSFRRIVESLLQRTFDQEARRPQREPVQLADQLRSVLPRSTRSILKCTGHRNCHVGATRELARQLHQQWRHSLHDVP